MTRTVVGWVVQNVGHFPVRGPADLEPVMITDTATVPTRTRVATVTLPIMKTVTLTRGVTVTLTNTARWTVTKRSAADSTPTRWTVIPML